MRILWAAETGNIDIVREMLNKNAELKSATDADGYTPLHRASYEGHCQVVEVCMLYKYFQYKFVKRILLYFSVALLPACELLSTCCDVLAKTEVA